MAFGYDLSLMVENRSTPSYGGSLKPDWKALGLLALSGALLCAAFVPELHGVCAFVALVPALLAARRLPPKHLFFIAWVVGYLVNLFLFYWIALVTWPGWLMLPLYTGLYIAVFLWGVEILARRRGVPRVLGAICLWGLLELLRGWLLTGLPWFYLGHALYRWTRFIQAADLGGVILVSIVVVAVNALLAEAVCSPSRGRAVGALAVACGLIVAMTAYGAATLASLEEAPGPVVAVVQPNVPQGLKISQTATDSARIFRTLRAQTLSAARQADVIFWPETIMPGIVGVDDYSVANGMSEAEIVQEYVIRGALRSDEAAAILKEAEKGADFFELLDMKGRQDPAKFLRTYNLLAATARLAGKPLVAGVIAAKLDKDGNFVGTYNRAYHFNAGGHEVAFYDKVHLVPFGEYVPFRERAPAVAKAFARIMPVEPNVYEGEGPVTFKIGGYVYGPVICFEDTFSHIARAYRIEGAEILVNLTNDGWFGGTFELEAHLANAVFRSVETRMALVRAANTGISGMVTPSGVISARLRDGQGRDREVSGMIAFQVPVSTSRTLYTAIGDWWLAGLLVVLAGFVIRGLPRGV